MKKLLRISLLAVIALSTTGNMHAAESTLLQTTAKCVAIVPLCLCGASCAIQGCKQENTPLKRIHAISTGATALAIAGSFIFPKLNISELSPTVALLAGANLAMVNIYEFTKALPSLDIVREGEPNESESTETAIDPNSHASQPIEHYNISTISTTFAIGIMTVPGICAGLALAYQGLSKLNQSY